MPCPFCRFRWAVARYADDVRGERKRTRNHKFIYNRARRTIRRYLQRIDEELGLPKQVSQ